MLCSVLLACIKVKSRWFFKPLTKHKVTKVNPHVQISDTFIAYGLDYGRYEHGGNLFGK